MTIARLSDISFCPACCHSCPACCHVVQGPAITGSEDAYLNGRPILRAQGRDQGIHCCCCGPNMWWTLQGSEDSFVDGLPIVRHDDTTRHCGGLGWMITSSDDSNVNY